MPDGFGRPDLAVRTSAPRIAEEAIAKFNRALGDTLRRAGYDVTESGPHDVSVVPELHFAMEGRQSRHGSIGQSELVRVVFHVYGQSGAELDRFELRSMDESTPLGSSESVAVDLVNAMVQSPKVGAHVDPQKRSAEAVD